LAESFKAVATRSPDEENGYYHKKGSGLIAERRSRSQLQGTIKSNH
jgi:hypothetical protein